MVAWLHDAAPQAELGESYACDVADLLSEGFPYYRL